MTPEIESQIEQREAMLLRAKQTIKAAREAIDATDSETVKLQHQTVINHRKQRVDDLVAQIAQLRGSIAKEEPLTAS